MDPQSPNALTPEPEPPEPIPPEAIPPDLTATDSASDRATPLEAKPELLQEVLDHLPDAVYVKDAHSRYVIGNLAHTRFLGLECDAQVAGTTVFDHFPREQAEQFYADDQEVLRTGQPLIGREEKITRPGGGDGWVVTSKVPLRDREGRVVGLVAITKDITDRKRADEQLREANAALRRREEELLRAVEELRASGEKLDEARLQVAQMEKLRSVGRLAAGVAHEVKNPLAVIAMGLAFLDRCPTFPSPELNREASEVRRMMKDALARADVVIRGLLDFAAPTRVQLQPRDLNELVRRSLTLVAHDLTTRRVSVTTELADGLPAAAVDGGKAEQVLINLFTNAAHAMAGGGALIVRTRRGCDHAAPGTLVVEVDDTGPGVPDDLLPKIFDPFVTTKPPDTGTGLGLTVTRTIMELHGGGIEIRNRPEGGARATVTFRCAEPGAVIPS